MQKNIPFNVPFITTDDEKYVIEALRTRHVVGDGPYTKKCHSYFEQKYGVKKALLTSSCTDALEMCALLLNIKSGDEIIIPSYTFVSTANAFALHGATIRFADSQSNHPNMDINEVEKLITHKTKAVVVVHYAGHACDMDHLITLSKKHGFIIIEDAAQAIFSYYKDQPLGTVGHLGTFSFHATKNIISGEGGLLAINDPQFIHRAEVIREKGTNRSAFFRGEVDKYTWVDVGSSYLCSDLNAAFLLAQLERAEEIQKKRLSLLKRYQAELEPLEQKNIMFPQKPPHATDNAHLFFMVCKSLEQRTHLFEHLKKNRIQPTSHYVSLHNSPFFKTKHDGRNLVHADRYTDCLIRLPLYPDLTENDQTRIINATLEFFK